MTTPVAPYEAHAALRAIATSGGAILAQRFLLQVGDGLDVTLQPETATLPARYFLTVLPGAGVTFGSPVAIGTANSPGSSGDGARADHVHAHGNLLGGSLHAIATALLAGFMSAADKGKLDLLPFSNFQWYTGTFAGGVHLLDVDITVTANTYALVFRYNKTDSTAVGVSIDPVLTEGGPGVGSVALTSLKTDTTTETGDNSLFIAFLIDLIPP